MTYEIGDFLTNDQEVSHNAVVAEIMVIWEDPDDGEVNYIIKCRKITNVLKNEEGVYQGNFPWFSEDELKLVNEFTLEKYYRQYWEH